MSPEDSEVFANDYPQSTCPFTGSIVQNELDFLIDSQLGKYEGTLLSQTSTWKNIACWINEWIV